jgi:hypothetical protein
MKPRFLKSDEMIIRDLKQFPILVTLQLIALFAIGVSATGFLALLSIQIIRIWAQ